MSLCIVDIHGSIEGDYEIVKKYEEPKTGHWLTLKDEYGDIIEAVCSVCDKNSAHEWNYCPHCGSKMEVKSNDQDD